MCVGRTIAICCRFMLVVLLFTGMILSIMAVSSCDFMKAIYEVPNNILGGNSSETVTMDAALGLWQYETTEGCKAYRTANSLGSANLFQNEHQEIVAQKSGVAAPSLALVALVLVLLELCCCGRGKCGDGCSGGIPCLKFLLALLLTAMEICQGLTFLLMNSHQFCHGNADMALLKHHCELSKGGSLSAAALIVFVLCSALLSCTPSNLTSRGGKAAANTDVASKDADLTAANTGINSTTTKSSTTGDNDFDDVSFDDELSQSKMQGTMA